MASASITLTVTVAWWVRPYLACLTLFCRTMGMEPDFEKVGRTVARGLRVRCK